MSVLSATYKAQLASLLAAEKDLSALKSALKELGADAALMGASMLPPPAGTAADIASLAVSLGRGDWGGALWDVVGLIPIVGDGAKAVGKGAKVANRMKDLEKAIAKAEKVLAKKQDDLSRLCKNSRVGKDKTTQAARHSSCVDCGDSSIKKMSTKLKPGTPRHKTDRWEKYKKRGGKYSYERWSKQYDINMHNYKHGLKRESDYRKVMEASEGTLKTPLTKRQIDILKAEDMYAGQLKTGPVSLTKENAIAIQKDAELVKRGWEVEHILEKGASKPYIQALEKSGIKYHLGSKIPN